jgi:cytochrome P450
MREILTDPELSSSDKTAIRLKSEAKTILNAGTGTVSWALVTAVWYLTTMPDKMERLREEIRTVMPDPLCPAELTKLEQLPYFTAVLQETLRLGFGAPMRSARAAPDRILTYIDQKSSKEWQIPQGTAVSVSDLHSGLGTTPV